MDDNRSEYDRLIKPIENRMIGSVWRITRNPEDAEDAFQDALMTIWKQFEKVSRHPNQHALILKICANSAYDILRKKSRRGKREELHAHSLEYQDSQRSADELLSNKETRIEIFQAISQLSRNQAVTVLMRFVQELPYSDIARVLGCSEATARKHVARARTRLSKILAPLLPGLQKEKIK